jgi:mRNA interferase HigB
VTIRKPGKGSKENRKLGLPSVCEASHFLLIRTGWSMNPLKAKRRAANLSTSLLSGKSKQLTEILKVIDTFCKRRPEAKTALTRWASIVTLQAWRNFAEIRSVFPSADLVGACTVFNIGGNRFRLIGKVNYAAQIVRVTFVLTHKEYDKEQWKKDCTA